MLGTLLFHFNRYCDLNIRIVVRPQIFRQLRRWIMFPHDFIHRISP